jgi:hypothetical protein
VSGSIVIPQLEPFGITGFLYVFGIFTTLGNVTFGIVTYGIIT